MYRHRKLPVLLCLVLILILSSSAGSVKAQDAADTDSDLALDLAQHQKNPDPEQATIAQIESQGATVVSQSLTGESVSHDVAPQDVVVPEATKEKAEDVAHPEQQGSEEVKTVIVTPPPAIEVQTQGGTEANPTPSDIAPLDDNAATPVPTPASSPGLENQANPSSQPSDQSSPQPDQNATPSDQNSSPASSSNPFSPPENQTPSDQGTPSNTTPGEQPSPADNTQSQTSPEDQSGGGSAGSTGSESSGSSSESTPPSSEELVQGASTGPNLIQRFFGSLFGIFRR